MRTINTFIPSDLVDSLKKFADKTQKNVEGFTYSVGKPYEKLFYHFVIEENGMAGKKRMVFHEVCDLIINMPDESDWRLIATYMETHLPLLTQPRSLSLRTLRTEQTMVNVTSAVIGARMPMSLKM